MDKAKVVGMAVGALSLLGAPGLCMELDVTTLAKYRAEILQKVAKGLEQIENANDSAVKWTIDAQGKVIGCEVTKSSGHKDTDDAIVTSIKSQSFAPIPWGDNQSDRTVIMIEPVPFNVPSSAVRGLKMSGGESVYATCGKQKISIGSGSSVTGGTISVGGGKDSD